MRALLIVNPHATATTERRRDLLAHALAGEVDLRVVHTAGRNHAADLAAAAAADGTELVVVHGGDGTVNETVNGLLAGGIRPDNPMLAVVPGGSTNVFARAIGVDADPTAATEQILEALIQQRDPRTVSLGRAGDRYFTFNAGMGLDAAVVQRVEQHRSTGKAISNALHVRAALATYRDIDRRNGTLTVAIPGREPLEGCHLAFVSNVDPWTYLGRRPVHTNPGTSPDGGLGVFAATSMGPATVTRVVTQLLRGTERGPHSKAIFRHDDVPTVTVTSTVNPIGVQMDGDYVGEWSTVVFRSVPRALRVIV